MPEYIFGNILENSIDLLENALELDLPFLEALQQILIATLFNSVIIGGYHIMWQRREDNENRLASRTSGESNSGELSR